jgi:hypothetical protein
MTDKKDILTIKLSQEELFLVLMKLRLPLIPGLNDSELTKLPKDQLDLVLGTAERALFARNFVMLNELGKPAIEVAVSAAVGACAAPGVTIALMRTFLNQTAQACYFHTTGKMKVSHFTPMPGIHQFDILASEAVLLRQMGVWLNLPPIASIGSPQGLIPEDLLNLARDAALGGKEKEASVLLVKALDGQTAAGLAAALARPIANLTFGALRYLAEDQTRGVGYSVLQGENTLWQFTPQDDPTSGPRQIEILPVSTETVLTNLAHLLLPDFH